jgi:hypothetical protein
VPPAPFSVPVQLLGAGASLPGAGVSCVCAGAVSLLGGAGCCVCCVVQPMLAPARRLATLMPARIFFRSCLSICPPPFFNGFQICQGQSKKSSSQNKQILTTSIVLLLFIEKAYQPRGVMSIINLAIKYYNYVIPDCPESFFEFNLFRCPIPDRRG